jgi:hypothetical protein
MARPKQRRGWEAAYLKNIVTKEAITKKERIS